MSSAAIEGPRRRARIAVLISGRGSNLSALIAASEAPDFPGEIALVISNIADAGGLDLARAKSIPTELVEHRPFGRDRATHEAAIDAVLRAAEIEWVCLAGYMRRLTPLLVERWAGRMINIHPSLLPSFPGLDTHARALASGVKIHGCTVHEVTVGVDEGPILGQAAIAVRPADDEHSLAARVLAQEHALYPAVLRRLLEGADQSAACETNALISI